MSACKPCRLAADIMDFKRSLVYRSSSYYDEVSKDLHEQCKGKTHCVCQHIPVSEGLVVRATSKNGNSAQASTEQHSGVSPEDWRRYLDDRITNSD